MPIPRARTAHQSGINWTWFLRYRIPKPGKIEILHHWRVHHGDAMPKHNQAGFDIIEKGQDKFGNSPKGYKIGNPRIADRVVLGRDYNHLLKVVNPKHIFDYR